MRTGSFAAASLILSTFRLLSLGLRLLQNERIQKEEKNCTTEKLKQIEKERRHIK